MNWLKGLPDSLISKIVSASESKLYNEGDTIMTQGGEGDGMIVITRGV